MLGFQQTGLDVLEQLGFGENAILVTSHYENTEILARCQSKKIKLLPKNLVAHIPIKLLEKSLDTKSRIKGEMQNFDLVLIDDDETIRQSWQLSMIVAKKKILICASKDEFLKVKDTINKQTPLYIDSHLSDNEKGEDLAKSLFDEGFTEIYLETGHPASEFKAMPWIKAILGKDPPTFTG